MTQLTPRTKHPNAIQPEEVWKHLTPMQKAQAYQTLVQICQNLAQKILLAEAKHEHNHSTRE